MASALASLTANYTDSEGEEDQSREEEQGDRLHPSLAERLGKLGDSPGSNGSGGSLVRQSNSQSGEDTDHGHGLRYWPLVGETVHQFVNNVGYFRDAHQESQACILH